MYFPQANETQDPSDMSDPSEVNQPHPVLFVQGPGRYIQVPYYVPVPTQPIYSNYTVDPNQPHWFAPPPYGNAPILNGRQSENDGTESESNVEDERSATTSFPPPGVGLPAASTMQQHHLYQVMPPFSNVYVGSIPSGVSVQGYVNSPIPYPTPYPGIATGGEPNALQNNNRRGGGGGGKGGSGKLANEKQGGANDSSYNAAAPPLTPQDSNAGNDPSTPSLPPTSMPMVAPPQHPQPNFMPLGAMQYSYPYFSPTGPPHPPPHMTSAQHATGSPIYIPHPSAVPMYHAPIYNSGPTAVFSSDNGMPHSAVSVPVSVAPPPADVPAGHNEAAFGVKQNAVEGAYKNSTLMADSAPFEPENQKQNNVNFAQDNASSAVINDVTMENSTLPEGGNEMTVNDIGQVAENEKRSTVEDDKFQGIEIVGPVSRNVESAIEDDAINAKRNIDNLAASMNDLHVAAKEDGDAVSVVDKNAYSVNETNDKSVNANSPSNTFETDNKSIETTGSWNDTKNITAVETMNGKNSSSLDTSPSSAFDLSGVKSTSSSETKSEAIEEPAPVQGNCKKSWASLFKESSSSVKSKPSAGPIRSVPGETVNSTVSTSSSQHVDSVSSKSSSGNSSLNGMPSISSSHSGKSQSYKLSSPSLADDTMLPKIGELLKNYKLDHRAVNIEPRGLENRSNYCYINAILQALLACPPFYNLMKSISHNLHHKTKLATKQHFPIIDSMVQFVEEFKLVPQKARRDKTRKLEPAPQEIIPGKPFEPIYMYNMLSVIQNNSTFTMGQQEDAQEFLTCLLNGLNDEMVELIQLAEGTNNVLNNNRKTSQQATKPMASKNNKKISNGDISTEVLGPDDCDSEWKQVQSKIKPHRPNLAVTRTPLSEIFRGQMRSRLQKIGDQCTNSIEPFFTLHLNIEKANSVKEALELLVGRDLVEGVTSSRTNQEVDAWQQQNLEELPYVLLLHLKYFDYKHHTCTKIKRSIEFPIDLKLDTKLISPQSSLRSRTASNKSRQYKLFAVVYHDGNEATKGHYITDVFHIGYGGWVRYDDARVCTVSENDVLKPDLPRVPYLLYYRRCDTIAALMQPPFEKRM